MSDYLSVNLQYYVLTVSKMLRGSALHLYDKSFLSYVESRN